VSNPENPDDGARLASEVLLQAIRDVFGANQPGVHGDCPITSAKSDALSFLTSQHGEWRQSRRDWCDLAGIDPDIFDRGIAARLKRATSASSVAAGEVAAIVKSRDEMLAKRRARRERNGEYMRNNLTRRAKREMVRVSC
jgi:hypothetical protein